jgi:hypothetical protein
LKIQPVVLAEGLRKSSFESLVGMPPQLLPMAPSVSLLACWYAKLAEVPDDLPPLEILVSSSQGYQSMDVLSADPRFKRVIDPRPHRGTGGVLADYLTRRESAYEDLDYLFVIERSGCPPRSLRGFFQNLESNPDILIGVSELDRLVGIMAIKPHVLELVPEVGYFDLKEQTVDKAVQCGLSVTAAVIMPRAIQVRSLRGWLDAIRYLNLPESSSGEPVSYSAHGTNCIDPGARIGKAVILDSIVMENATVENGAIIARSVLCPGAHVASGTHVIDSIIGRSKSAMRS